MNGIAEDQFDSLETVKEELKTIFEELMQVAELEEGDILVVGCSSSEIAGHRIGSWSSAQVGKTVFLTLQELCRQKHIFLAAQCCEHLNRAIIIERAAARQHHLNRVNVIPQLKAGGSFATAAYEEMEDAVAVETVRAQAGIDIGDTLIGMHLEPVAVPVRPSIAQIGSAHVVCARTRLKYIGGVRAAYSEKSR